MPRFTIKEQAQQVGQGLQDPVTLVNAGNATIFLDSDSSISENSYPLPPLATIAWDGGLQLWAKTAEGSESILNMTFNSVPADASRSNVQQLIRHAENPNPALLVWTVNDIDCTVYETLLLRLNINPLATIPTVGEMMEIIAEWKDDAGNALKNEIFWTPGTGGTDIIMAIPVKGGRVDFNFFGIRTVDMITGIDVYGLTRKIRPYVFPFQFFYNGGGSVEAYRDGANVDNFLATEQLWIPNLGSRLQVIYRFSATITAAGTLVVSDGLNLSTPYGFADIPTATGTSYVKLDCVVPISRPIFIRPTAFTGGGQPRLTAVFQDVDIT